MQLELAQIPLVDGAVAPNLERTLDAIGKRRAGTDLMVFPEATLTGFPTRENVRDIAETLSGPSLTRVRDAARDANVAVAVGLAERDGERFYNTTVLIDERGEIALQYRKTHLWATDVGVFTPGDRYEVCEFKGMTVGLLICYDIEFPETARAVGTLGAEMLVVTNGNMDPFGPVHRRAIVARAMENQMFAALVNRIGDGDDNLTFPGESALISPFGDVLAELKHEDAVLPVTVDRALLAQSREHYSYLHDARIALNLVDENDAQGRRSLNIRARTR
ncbi:MULTISPECIES: carbon-nitrogen hydrolase family protein [Paraburkholderia]|uniref:(R)-amidase n=1 Tax=Paraburkholderia tropica TaxID=92647 RepID=A0A1A5XLQ8_9BURK|nr:MULTISPECIES: carbon-nitrogen hydrolase family protein [Paraburkholderia]MBB2978506.1 (R)-amidase [Paraburkholderia tropica]MBB2998700.1 (R)-amidase [Paraburkholderia tropica]MBB6318525.1 (R)-amidase [Paraburkholderia tropica]MDE1139443.1 carbon-nitrogen hydrolase family protein [Paraburkholderia tropica]OBR54446.1 carbon-nitrogen hydrolase [Paraburkholderia tropica]